MTNKERYEKFCEKTYVPVFSKPWWLDAVCGEENWDVWICGEGADIVACMPYFKQNRNGYKYITKAPLTQTNGIIFNHNKDSKLVSRHILEEKVINSACEYIKELDIAVYEQQFPHTFNNWQPFFWNGYQNNLRYTYIIGIPKDGVDISENYTSDCRRNIKKGNKVATIKTTSDYTLFYKEHEKIYIRQGLQCPFSFELWKKLYTSSVENKSGEMVVVANDDNTILSLIFIVTDEKYSYQILGGNMPEYSNLQSYATLIDHCIRKSHEKGLAYDFEGSMIKRIAKSFREYGGVPTPYYRIRKVFNKDILEKEYLASVENV